MPEYPVLDQTYSKGSKRAFNVNDGSAVLPHDYIWLTILWHTWTQKKIFGTWRCKFLPLFHSQVVQTFTANNRIFAEICLMSLIWLFWNFCLVMNIHYSKTWQLSLHYLILIMTPFKYFVFSKWKQRRNGSF